MLGITGRRAEARETLVALDARGDRSDGSSVAFDKALVHYGLGETERALELLEGAIEDRDWRVRLLKAEPIFDALRSEPRFGRLLERAGFRECRRVCSDPLNVPSFSRKRKTRYGSNRRSSRMTACEASPSVKTERNSPSTPTSAPSRGAPPPRLRTFMVPVASLTR